MSSYESIKLEIANGVATLTLSRPDRMNAFNETMMREMIAAFERLDVELAAGGRVYVHCSAGLHRTGMFAHAFLRHRGLTSPEAVETIAALRPLTAAELTPERMAWGDRFVRPR